MDGSDQSILHQIEIQILQKFNGFNKRGRVGELNLASRRAEEAGAVYRKIHDHYFVALSLRRYQAVHWLDYLVGPLGIPTQPSEREFISCLRNGLILCNVINKIQPGSVPKVIETTMPSQSLLWDSQPLPAYQYFENIRNFLVAAEELKLPIFEASVFERDNLEEGSASKVVDCILALKAYHEWKQMTGGSGIFKPPRSPLVVHSAGRIHAHSPGLVSCDSSRQLDMSGGSKRPIPSVSDIRKLEDTIVKALAEHMVDTKENIDNNLVASYRRGSVDSVKFFSKILSSCLEEQFQRTFPEMRSSILDHLRERSCSPIPTSVPLVDLYNLENRKSLLEEGSCNHWNLVEQQERELSNIKLLLSSARKELRACNISFKNLEQLEIRSCASDNGMALPDATLHPVGSTVDVINLMKLGQENRAVGSTAINIRSSRSHSILSVHVHGEDASGSLFRSCLHLVDLAGSERVDKSEVTGDGLQEAQNINKSLACLVDVITALAQKNSHIPYRNSKLTLLLQNSLGTTNAITIDREPQKALGDKEVQTPLTRKTKEAARTPSEKLKTMTERTPPRPRRLSIENGKTMALERSTNNDDKRGAKTPVKPKQFAEKTPPPRSRRLSIENVTTAPVERSINHIDKRGAKTPPAAQTRSRRLSLEGPRNLLKDSDQIKLPEMMSKPIKPDERCLQNHSQLEDGKSITNTCGEKERSGSLLNRPSQRGPRSPLSSAPKSPLLKIDTATMKLQSEIANCRNQQKMTGATTPLHGTGTIPDAKSPTSSNGKALRRQSITSIQQPERSRRSSLGGVSTDSYGNDNRNAKTPPQVRASIKLTKRWL
ncbi:UNVERIFIED_CONTAM: Kinesin-like protein KIN-14L [Sesamum radiatum]|uniref:Kinesin-like protein KIN-14L n=1 Tax=Sesamum radiatum TaxID=300843 RepID=A0AAW2TL24_SESRA